MALTQRHRASIYRSLVPMLGEEETEALLSHFPARDLDEPVTKEFVRAEFAGRDAEFAGLRAEFADLRAEVADRFERQTKTLATMFAASTTVVVAAIAVLGFVG